MGHQGLTNHLCKQCKARVPLTEIGIGDWYVTESKAERGPYCSEECMEKARREGF